MEVSKKTKEQKEKDSQHISNNDHLLNKIFFQKYRTIKKLGEGSFGKVYKAEYNKIYYAMKFENKTRNPSLLESEATIMNYLRGPNIPNIESFGTSGEYNILIMQLMDKSLEDLINIYKKFSVKTVCLLAYQMINILQFIHDKHIIHRDIKPDNFVMGYSENNAHLYIIDFGLAKKFRSSRTLVQYPYIKKKKLTGTARYASIHALEEYEQSRRDDLESMSYVLIYFLKGYLPWQGLKVKVKEDRYKKILEKKKEINSEKLCEDLPSIFQIFVDYTRNLEYLEEPDYDKFKNIFFNYVTNELNETFEFLYDWTTSFDINQRKDFHNNLISNFQISEKKNNLVKESGRLHKRNKKDELTTTNGNNLTLYKTIQSETYLNNSRNINSISNINIVLENKDLNETASSKCCFM